jgi:hypothetical protein
MGEGAKHPDRRAFLKWTAIAAAGCAIPVSGKAKTQSNRPASPFDGKTLNGWMQIQNSATSFGSGDFLDFATLAKKITEKSDAVSAFLSERLDDAVKAEIGAGSPSEADVKAAKSALAKNLNKIILAALIYDKGRFQTASLRPETQELLKQNPQGRDLVRLNRMLLEDAYPTELAKSVPTGWIAKDGAMASTGTGRGVIYSANDYSRFRWIFTMRHVSGNPDHQACVLIFCARPRAEEMPLDALGGIQFQVPNGGHWDYRPGQNVAGGEEFTTVFKPKFDPHEWSRVEILADAAAGTARMAVAQPVGSKAVEVLNFKNAEAGKIGPIALQIHNAGLFDEYKDLTIDLNPASDELITVK